MVCSGWSCEHQGVVSCFCERTQLQFSMLDSRQTESAETDLKTQWGRVVVSYFCTRRQVFKLLFTCLQRIPGALTIYKMKKVVTDQPNRYRFVLGWKITQAPTMSKLCNKRSPRPKGRHSLVYETLCWFRLRATFYGAIWITPLKCEMLSFFWLQTNFSFRCNIVNGTSTVWLAFPDSQKKLGQS